MQIPKKNMQSSLLLCMCYTQMYKTHSHFYLQNWNGIQSLQRTVPLNSISFWTVRMGVNEKSKRQNHINKKQRVSKIIYKETELPAALQCKLWEVKFKKSQKKQWGEAFLIWTESFFFHKNFLYIIYPKCNHISRTKVSIKGGTKD